jgi:hypothetical protein
MRSKTKLLLAATLLTSTVAGCQEPKIHFRVKVSDDEARPIKNCEVTGSLFDHWENDQGFGKDIYKKAQERTDDAGWATISSSSSRGDIYYSAKAPEGYYKTYRAEFVYHSFEGDNWVPVNKQFEIILKRIKNPIPMYARNLTNEGGGGLRIPALDRDCGYDFELGDWVVPNGKGKTGDLVFHSAFSKDASGDSKRVLKVSFPGVGDGLFAFDKDLLSGSELSSDYMAPADGYQQTVTFTRTIVNLKVTDDQSPNRNYYFRVRSKTDANGRIISANYGKIYGNFMSFIYYFNPNLNDRNVEFDPKRNLFQKLPENMRVTQP